DIYLNVAGGYKIGEPAADLAVCLAIISSFKNKALPDKTCAFGEVGLLGEIRRVNQEEKREKEARRMGFSKTISSKECKNLREASNLASS
ncbi:MAG TPA: magnesium chelatase domain-containing protein, partial [Candidatus Woesebacteria bacterium]|nr:magnesium chelatase domain-containing protein [Candidatus Woesebacteria bacterium]